MERGLEDAEEKGKWKKSGEKEERGNGRPANGGKTKEMEEEKGKENREKKRRKEGRWGSEWMNKGRKRRVKERRNSKVRK